MNRLLTIIIVLITFSVIQAQSGFEDRCPYKGIQVTDSRITRNAGDFTITTTDGITRNLYNTLDSGKTVFVDLFFTTCGYCQLYAPVIEEIYQNTGAGQENIVFWGISNNLGDPDAVIDQYKINYNISNPCAGPNGGGTTAHTTVISGQNFYGWPTYVVICPDRTLFFDPCYPPTVTGFDPYFEACAEIIGVEEGITISEKCIISIYPNPSPGEFNLDLYQANYNQATVELYNILGKKIHSQLLELAPGTHSYRINAEDLPSGTFFLKIFRNLEFIGSDKVLIYR